MNENDVFNAKFYANSKNGLKILVSLKLAEIRAFWLEFVEKNVVKVSKEGHHGNFECCHCLKFLSARISANWRDRAVLTAFLSSTHFFVLECGCRKQKVTASRQGRRIPVKAVAFPDGDGERFSQQETGRIAQVTENKRPVHFPSRPHFPSSRPAHFPSSRPVSSIHLSLHLDGLSETTSTSLSLDVYAVKMKNCKCIYSVQIIWP